MNEPLSGVASSGVEWIGAERSRVEQSAAEWSAAERVGQVSDHFPQCVDLNTFDP